jgi:drug/metabolite transporter (DMT)-like permease
MNGSQATPILLTLIAAVSGAGAQFFYKRAALKFTETPIWSNGSLFAGLLLFTLVLVLFIAAFRMGGRLFVIYPVYATTYIWVGLIGVFIDHEAWSWLQLAGVGTIIAGVALIGAGAHV